MLDAGPRPAPPRTRPPTAQWSTSVTRYEVTGGGGGGSGYRVTGVALLAMVIIAAATVVLPGAVGPGLGILAVGVAVALVLSGLNSPVVAMVLLLFTMFLRQALKIEALPAEPFLFAFAGVLGAGVIAVSRRVSNAPQFGPTEAMMALYVIWCIGSAFLPHTYPALVGNPAYYFIITGMLIPLTLYVVGRVVVERERAIRTLLWTIVGLAAYSTLVSVLQFYAPALVWPRYIVEFPESHSWSKRAVGVFANPVENGLMLTAGFLVALHLARQAGVRAGRRVLLYGFAIVTLCAIYLTHTRVVWLIFGLALVICAAMLSHIRAICVAILLAAGVGVALNWATIASDDRAAGGVTSSYEIEDRLNMIATAWWAVKEQPLVGWGITRFAQLNSYHHQQWSQEVPWARGYGIISHFNEFGIAAELGLIGLALWLSVLVLVTRGVLRAVRTIAPGGLVGREFAIIVAVLFLSLVVCGATVDLRYLGFISSLVMLLAGIVVGIADRLGMDPQPHAVLADRDAAAEEDELDSLLVSAR